MVFSSEGKALNTLYIGIGGTILLALIIALVGPLFVDWTSYRSAFEREASRVLGQPVRVLGTADMQILPLPHLQFGTVHVGADRDKPLLVIDQFDVRIELLPLIKGEVEVVDMTLTSPRLRLDLDEKGQLRWKRQPDLQAHLVPTHISLNDVIIKNGQLSLADRQTGRVFQLDDFNGNLAARDLFGPYKFESSFLHDGQPYSLMVSTGSPNSQGVRVKSLLTPANAPLTVAMDGLVSFDDGEGLHYRAKVNVKNLIEDGFATNGEEGTNRLANVPWSFSADADLSARGLSLTKLELEHGPKEQAYRVNGNASVDWGADPSFDVKLASRQLDLDRALGQGPNAPVDLQQALSAFGRLLQALPKPQMNGQVSFDVPGVILGGGIVRNFLFEARLSNKGEQGAWQIETLEADLPGNSRVALTGLYSARSQSKGGVYAFEGEGRLRSENPSAFAKWWLKNPTQQNKLAPFDLSGQIALKPDYFSLSRMNLTIEEDRVRGRIDWQDGKERVSDTGSGALTIVAEADKLDLDVAQGIGALLLSNNGADAGKISNISLDIKARRFVSGGFEGRSLAAKTYLSAGIVDVETLVIDDFEGAKIDVSGRLENLTSVPNGQVSGTLQAQKLDGLVALVKRLAPDMAFSRWFENVQASLQPADLYFTVTDRSAANGIVGSMSGKLGGGELELKVQLDGTPQQWTQAPMRLSAVVSQNDGSKLIGLLTGQDLVVPLPALKTQIELDGIVADGAKLDSRVLAEDGGLEFSGTLKRDGKDVLAKTHVEGDLALQADDLAPYFLALGLPMGDLAQALPVELSAKFRYEGDNARWQDLRGRWNRQPIAGDLVYRLEGNEGLMEGSLSLGDLDGYWLGESLLGPGRLTSNSTDWQDIAFLPPSKVGELYPVRLKLNVDARSMELAAPYILQQPKFELSWQPDQLIIRNMKGLLEGGSVSGNLQISNVDGQGVAKGHVQVGDVALAPLVWEREGRAVADGLLDSVIDFEAQGRSLAGMVSTLSGSGAFTVKKAVLRYLNPSAFDLVVRAVDAGLPLEDKAISDAFQSHLDAGSVNVASLDGTFRLAGGALRTGSIGNDSDGLLSRGSLTMDLNEQTLAGDWSISVKPREEDAVTGAVPEVGVVFSGALAEPKRLIDVAPFTGYLSIRAFEREVDRIETMQADILEKEGFRRKIKLYRQEAKRREIDALAAKEEAERRAKEEIARKAQEALEAKKAREAELVRQAEEKRRAEEEARKAQEAEAARQQEESRLAREAEEVRLAEEERKAEEARKAEAARQELLRLQEVERLRIEELRRKQRKPRKEWINPDELDPNVIEIKPLAPLKQGSQSSDQPADPLSFSAQNGIVTGGIETTGTIVSADETVGADAIQVLPNRLRILPKAPARGVSLGYERGSQQDLFERLRQSPDLIIQLD